MIQEITVKITFSGHLHADSVAAVIPSSEGVEIAPPALSDAVMTKMIPVPPEVGAVTAAAEIAPPTLGVDTSADMIPVPPDVDADSAMITGTSVPSPPALADTESEHLPPPDPQDVPGSESSQEDSLPPLPGRGAKRGR
jgi:hypothetical protein